MRQLLPHYYVSTRPIGWKCSDCGQVFGDRETQVGAEPFQAPSAAVQTVFAAHNCEAYRVKLKQHRQSFGD
jgi:hypothetical protein